MSDQPRLVVVGLGYVGLPLAVALARHYPVLGFDANPSRIADLRAGRDRTGEVPAAALAEGRLELTDDPAAIAGADVYIVAVPTPVGADKRPDLAAVRAASETVGAALRQGTVAEPIVVYESTVYPGVTEDVCGPILEAVSGRVCGRDFFLGYSPERINPGDREHTVERITKVVAGQTPDVAAWLAAIYGAINGGNIFVAKDIRTAEAAKVIENAQRDINIAFVNEVTMIFGKMGISVYDVLDAARTKWNFLGFAPGLVGGHCIGVDPFYLAQAAAAVGHNPEVVLAGRRINDAMGGYLAQRIAGEIGKAGAGRANVLVLGLTFKENVPDLRNTRVVDLVRGLQAYGHDVTVHDPLADPVEAKREYGIDLVAVPGDGYDCVVAAVPHRTYDDFDLGSALRPGGLVADIKGLWRGKTLPNGIRWWSL